MNPTRPSAIDSLERPDRAEGVALIAGAESLAARVSRSAALLVAVIGGLGFVGRERGITLVESWAPDLPRMAESIAISLLLLAGGLAARRAGAERLARVAACLAMAIVLFSVAHCEWPRWFWQPAYFGDPHPGSVIAVLLSACALFVSEALKWNRLFQFCAWGAGAIAWFGLTALLFDFGGTAPSLIVGLPLPSATALAVLSMGILALRPRLGFVGLLLSPYQGGQLARTYFPIALLAPVVGGWLNLAGQSRGLFLTHVGLALYSSFVVAVISAVAMFAARRIDLMDRRRAQLEEEARFGLEQTRKALTQAIAYLEAAPGGMPVGGATGRVEMVNGEVERMFAARRSGLIGQSVEFICPELAGEVQRLLEGPLLDGHIQVKRECHAQRKEGAPFPLEVILSPLMVGDERAVIASMRDMTEQRRAANVLAERTRRLEEAQRIAHLGGWEWSLDNGHRSWSDELFHICGLEPGRVPPSPEEFEAMLHPDDRPRAAEAFAATIRSGVPLDEEFRLVRPDGQVRFVRARGERREDAEGRSAMVVGSILDVTELKKGAQLLAAEEQRWNFALEGAESGVWDWNVQTGETFYSKRLVAMLGYEMEEFMGRPKPWASRLHPEDGPRVLGILDEHLRGLTPAYRAEYRLRCKDGSFRWMLDRGCVMTRTPDGKPERVIGTHLDITERKEIEERLRRSEEALREAQQLAQLGRWEWDLTTDEVTWSAELYRIVGRDPAQPFRRPAEQAIAFEPESWRRLQEATARSRETGRPYRLDLELIRPDGSRRWVYARGQAVRNSEGEVVRLYGTVQDLTELKRTELELEAVTQRLRLATEAAGLGIWDWNVVSGRLVWDQQMGQLYGLGGAEMPSSFEAWGEAIHPDDVIDVQTSAYAALTDERPFDTTFRVLWPDGSVHHMRAFAIVQRDGDGQPIRLVGTHQDITEQVLAHEQITASLAEKEVLLKEVHHRVKNNMQVISSLLQLHRGYLRDAGDQEMIRDCQTRLQSMAMVHERVYRSGDFARIEFGEHLRELCHLVQQAQIAEGRSYRLEIEAEAIEVSLDVAIPLGLMAVEILTNTFKHAFQERSTGRVHVLLSRGMPEGLVLKISDDGVGLPREFDWENGGTLGMRLIRSLGRQLRAEVSFFSERGAVIAISLKSTVLTS